MRKIAFDETGFSNGLSTLNSFHPPGWGPADNPDPEPDGPPNPEPEPYPHQPDEDTPGSDGLTA